VAKARENEDATVLTIPANMTLDAAVGDTLPEIVDLTVKGTLRIDANLALGKLKNLTVAKGRLETTSNFPAIEKIDLNGTLIGSTTTYWDTVTSLTVKGGTWQLPDAVFTKLTSLTIEEGTVLNAGKATFAGLVNLSIAQNAGLVAPKGTFEKVTNKDFAPSGTLVVNGTLTVGDNTATELFKALKKLEVNGSLTATTDTIAGTETVFPVLTDLTVNGYVSTNAPDAFKALVNLTVNNGATFVANGALTTLSKVGTLTVNNRQFSATAATWAGVKSLRVDGELSAPAGTFAATTSVTVNGKLTANTAIWDKVTSLTVNGEFSATAGTFAGVTALDLNGKLTGGPASTFVKLTTAANIKGTGELVATGQVPIGTAAKPGTAKLLFDSTLSSLTLGSTYDVAVKPLLGDLVVKEGTSRTFTVKDASAITGSITVDKGGTLIFADDDVAPVPGLNKAITVSGTLKFNGDNVVPGAITVKSGGTLEFNGNAAAPAGIITVDGGGKLAFNGIDPVPAGDIAVNGEMLVKDGTTVTIAAGKELKVNGTLTATDLELKGVTYKVPAGGSLVIKALLSGSTMTATVLAGALDGTFAIAPGGYIQDTTPKQSWTLQGGSRGGSLVYTGSTTKAIILGDGSITTTETGAKMKTAGYVLLTGTASLVVHDYVGSGETIGLNLSKVVIDLTPVQPSDSASIIVEPYGKLNLAASTGAGTLTVAGCIVTDNAQLKGASAPVKGVAARQPVSGDLLGTPGAAVLTGGKLNVPGLIGGGNSTVTIDAYDAFVNDDPDSGQITVVRLFE
jgi:hypothetical protein